MERFPGCNGTVPWWNVPERDFPNSYFHCGESPVPHGTVRNGNFRTAWIRPVPRLPRRNHLPSQFIFCTSAMPRFSCFSLLHLFHALDFALPSTLFLSDTVRTSPFPAKHTTRCGPKMELNFGQKTKGCRLSRDKTAESSKRKHA